MAEQTNIKAVPTNIITGFLGVGKTTAILNLLKNKPEDERWAVLVNEFGEIGIDGSLMQGQFDNQAGIFVKEVPGGCMCCAAGLPMQIALNQLLAKAKPDRLLIEPTGLGHPKEVLQVLCADHYRSVLAVQTTITLVDARKLSDERYTTHETFNQQIDVADIVIGNKQDLYEEGDEARLNAYVMARRSSSPVITFSAQGVFDPALLHGESVVAQLFKGGEGHGHHSHRENVNNLPFPASGYLKVENQGENYHSVGWRFSPEKTFDRRKLFSWLNGLAVERLKAVFITNEGVFGYNLTSDALTEMDVEDCLESKIEIISQQPDAGWESQLLACLVVV